METEKQNSSDLNAQWLKLDAEYRYRIENPDHYEMDEYLQELIAQEDYNFFCEMHKIKDEFAKWQADNQVNMALPNIIADQILRGKLWYLGRLFSQAFQNWLQDIKESGEDKKIEKDGKLRLSVLFMMQQSSESMVN